MKDNTFSLICDIEYKMSSFLEAEMKNTELAGFSHSYGKILLELNKYESLSMKELAKKINKSPQTLSTLVEKLHKIDLVRIFVCENDSRSKRVSITEQGAQVIPKIIDISKDLYAIQFANFSDAEKQELRRLLMKMQSNF